MKRAIILLLPAAIWLAGCNSTSHLPVMGEVPPFHLTAHTGEPFTLEQLRGNVWVANFFFTTCNGPCPRMSAQMRKLQQQTLDLRRLRLVGFTIDPDHDNVAALAAYANRFQARPGRWFLLTGSEAELNKLDYDTFHLGTVGGKLEHSTRFVLIDGRARIRGYYDSSFPEEMDQLLKDVRALVRSES